MSWGAIGGAAISTLGGALGGGQSGGQPRWLKRAGKSAVGRAEALSNRPYTAYTGPRVASLSQNEEQAGALARNWGNATSPILGSLQTDARFDPGALGQYQNPYLDQVLNNQHRVINEEYGRQRADLSRRQSAMDAFRTGRSDLARSRLDANRMTAHGDAEALARSGAFDRAMAAYSGDRELGVRAGLGALEGTLRSQAGQYGALAQSGATERGIQQAGMDFDYGQFLEGRDWDVNNFGVLLDSLRAVQGAQSNQTPSTAGLLTGLLGTAMSNGAFDDLFDKWTKTSKVDPAFDPGAV